MSGAEMNFGPDWLRALSDGGSNKNGSGGHSGSTGSNSGHLTVGHSSSFSSSKHRSVEFRYGREEMLALYDSKIKMQSRLNEFPELISHKYQLPLSLIPMTQEEHALWSREFNFKPKPKTPTQSTSSGGAPGFQTASENGSLDRERNLESISSNWKTSRTSGIGNPPIRTNQIGRGRGRPFLHHGGSFEEDRDANGSDLRASDFSSKSFDRGDEANKYQRSFTKPPGVLTQSQSLQENSTNDPSRIRKEFVAPGSSESSWRTNRVRTDNPQINRDWRARSRTEEPSPNSNNLQWKRNDRWREEPRVDDSNRRKNFVRTISKEKGWNDLDDDGGRQLPEWSLDDTGKSDPKFGTFDASGQFREEPEMSKDSDSNNFKSSSDQASCSQLGNESSDWNSASDASFKMRTMDEIEQSTAQSNLPANKSLLNENGLPENENQSAMKQKIQSFDGIFEMILGDPKTFGQFIEHPPKDEFEFFDSLNDKDKSLHPTSQPIVTSNTSNLSQLSPGLSSDELQKRQLRSQQQQSHAQSNVTSSASNLTQSVYGELFERSEQLGPIDKSPVDAATLEQWATSEDVESKEHVVMDEFGQKLVVYPPPHPNAFKFFYRDPQDQVQGPFSSQDMHDWFNSGYFSTYLLVRRGCDERFAKLGELCDIFQRLPFTPGNQPLPLTLNPINNLSSFESNSQSSNSQPSISQQPEHSPSAHSRPFASPSSAPISSNPTSALNIPLAPLNPLALGAPIGPALAAGPAAFPLQANPMLFPISSIAQPVPIAANPLLMSQTTGVANAEHLFRQQLQQQQILFNDQQMMQAQLKYLLTQLKKQDSFCAMTPEQQQEILIQQYMQAQQNEQLRRQLTVAAAMQAMSDQKAVGTDTGPGASAIDSIGSLNTMGALASPLNSSLIKTNEPVSSAPSIWGLNGEVLTVSALEEMQRQEQERKELELEKERREKAEEAVGSDGTGAIVKDNVPANAAWEEFQRKLDQDMQKFDELRKQEEELKRKQEEERRKREAEERAQIEAERAKIEQERKRVEQEKLLLSQERARQEEEQRRQQEEMELMKSQIEKRKREAEEKERLQKMQQEKLKQQQQMQLQQRQQQLLQQQKQMLEQEQQKHHQMLQQQQQQHQHVQMLQHQQQQQHQQQLMTNKEEKKAWGVTSQPTSGLSSTTSLAEIQRLQEKESLERQKQAHQMMSMMAAQQQQQQDAQRAKGWGNLSTAKPTATKTLAEIQREEAERVAMAKQMEEQKQRQMVKQSAGVWGNAASQLGWNSSTGVWGSNSNASKGPSNNQAGSMNTSSTGSVSNEPFWDSDPPLSASSLASVLLQQQQQQTAVKKMSDLLKSSSSAAVATGTLSSSSVSKSDDAPAFAAVASATKNKKSVETAKKEDEVKNVKNSKTPAHDEFMNWCCEELSKFQTSIDVPTFVAFLQDVESPHDVNDYVFSYLGENKESKEFSKKFLEKRSYYKNQAKKTDTEEVIWGPAPAITPALNKSKDEGDFSVIKGGKKKKKSAK